MNELNNTKVEADQAEIEAKAAQAIASLREIAERSKERDRQERLLRAPPLNIIPAFTP